MKDDFMEMLKVRADDGSCIYGYINYAGEAYDRLIEAHSRIETLETARDGAYTERNRLVALLATMFPSGTKKTAIPGWDEAWHGCVYIDLPNGQASWHYHDSEAHLFAHLPPYQGDWDGHSTEEKYSRIAALAGEKKDG